MPQPPLLETTDLSFGFGGDLVTDRVSLGIQPGEFLSIIGPNGAGKTTYFNLLSGMYRPASGRITFAGRDITRMSAPGRAQIGIARSFQVSNVFPLLTVDENVRLAAQATGRHAFQLLRPYTAYGADIARAHAALEMVSLRRFAAVPAGLLSHGDKRKLELAMAIVAEPRLILLDEPTSGVSAEDVPAMVDLIRVMRQAGNTTVIMVEHKMAVVHELSDRVAVLHQGRLLALGTPEQIQANETVQSAYLGTETL